MAAMRAVKRPVRRMVTAALSFVEGGCDRGRYSRGVSGRARKVTEAPRKLLEYSSPSLDLHREGPPGRDGAGCRPEGATAEGAGGGCTARAAGGHDARPR